jgi:hypothetical protein
VVARAVKEPPLLWRTFSDEDVELSDGGTVATQTTDSEDDWSHVTTGVELTEGRHYWEVKLLSENVEHMNVGVTRPNLDPVGDYIGSGCPDGWFTHTGDGSLYGNDKERDHPAGPYKQGDRVGVLLDLNNGSLLFFKNGVQHGPGYAAGSVTGPVVAAVELCFMSKMPSTPKMSQGTKRSRTQQHDAAQAQPDLPGREQLLFTSPEMQIRFGQKYCDEAQLLPLLLAHGLVCRVRTIEVEVRPLGGDSIMIRLDTTKPSVGEAKAEIARVQGTDVECQELYRVAVREDGGAVREDDAEPELLDDNTLPLEEGAVVVMAVKDSPLLWRTFPEKAVELSEGGTVATQTIDMDDDNEDYYSHVTTGVELTEGRHYWEVEILSEDENMDHIFVGVTRPSLAPLGDYMAEDSTDGWFTGLYSGSLFGNGKDYDDPAGGYKQGDRVGVLLDLNNGSLLFFKNGVQHGPGFPAGSVAGPVVAAAELIWSNQAVQLRADVAFPAGHVQ